MKDLIRSLEARLRRLPPLAFTAIGLCFVLALGAIDYCFPGPVSFVLFYLLAVVLVGWGAGKRPALLLSAVAVLIMVTVHWFLHRGVPQSGWVVLWNDSTRFLVFGLVGWLTAETTRLTRNLGRLVEQRTEQLKTETDQHQATSARLAEALERFEQLVNNIPEAFWLRDIARNQMVYISPGYERIWGRKCRELLREPKSWLAAVHPADRDAMARRAQTDQASGDYDIEYRILRPDGSQRWIRGRAFPVRNAQGEVYRIAGLAEDITERKQTRETLQTQAAILENMAEGVVVTDEQGLIVQMNPAAERIWGYERNEVLGQPVSVLSALPEPDNTKVMRDVLAALQASGTWRGTFQNRRKDGAIIACEAVISRVEIQGRVLLVAVEQDVTERLRAQERLQMQARVLESMAEAAYMVDDKGTIVLTNPAYDALLGYQRGELVGQSVHVMLTRASEEFQHELERHLEQVKAHGYATWEHAARRQDGTLIEMEVRSSNITLGDRMFMVVVGQDITQRKQAEQALRQSEESLRVFLDALPEPTFLTDREERVLVSNPALAKSLGVPADSLQGRNIHDLLPAKVGASRRAMFAEAVRNRQPVRFEDERAGRYFIHHLSPVLDPAGNVTRLAMFSFDITERKRAEQALARKEELYRTLFELSPNGILLEDTHGNILDANQALCESSGYTREELLRKNVRCFVPPEDQATAETHLAALRAGQTLEGEVWNLRKNGERRRVMLNEKPLMLPDGRQGVMVVAKDITETKRAEMTKAAFLSLGTKLNTATSPIEAARAICASADLLWKWDSATLDIYSPETDQMQHVLNCDVVDGQRREVPSNNPSRSTSPGMRRVMREGPQLMLREPSYQATGDFLLFGDVARPAVSVMIVPIHRDGQPIGVLSIQSYTQNAYTQEDLRTLQALADYCAGALDRIRAGHALRQREELNRSILATTMDGFYTLDFAADPGGAIIEVNEAFCHLTGYGREELLRMRMSDLEAAETLDEVIQHEAKIFATGGDRFETRHRRKNGEVIHVEISLSHLAGSSRQVFGFVRDITERKRADLTKEALLSLGTTLSEAENPPAAGRAVFATADQLWQWDAAVLQLYSPERDCMDSVLLIDVVNGQRREVPPSSTDTRPPRLMRRIMQNGPELLLRAPAPTQPSEFVAFGDAKRLSASLMYAPLRREGKAIGVLSIQSYAHNAYRPEDLRTLQALADYCGGALERIRAAGALRDAHDQLEQRVRERTTELQAANAALRQSEGKYRRLHETMTDALASVDLNGRFTESNRAYQELLGYTEAELRQLAFTDLTPRKWHAFEAKLLAEQVMLRGYSEVYEKEYYRKDGTVFPVELRVLLLRDDQGQPSGMWAIVRDITERKRAEEALRQAHDQLEHRVRERTAELQAANTSLRASEDRYRSLVNNLNVGVYRNLPGLAGGFVQANPALARMLGYDSPAELQKITVARTYQDPSQRAIYLAELMRQGTLRNYELRLKKKDGTPIYASVNATLHRNPNGEVDWIDGVLEDITEQKRSQEALRTSEERYRALAESSPDAIFILNPQLKVEYVNSTGAALWHRAPADLIGLAQSELFPPDSAQYHDKVVAQVFETGTPVHRDEPLAFPTGDQWIEIRLVPLYGERKKVVSVMGVCRDITERKRAEQQLAEALDLNQRILDASPMGIAAARASGECIFTNQAMASAIGATIPEVLRQNFRQMPSWKKMGLVKLADATLTQQRPRAMEVHGVSSLGKEVWLDLHMAPFTWGGKPHLLCMQYDISDRKQNEALLQAQRDLAVGFSLTSDLGFALNSLLEIATRMGGVDSGAIYLLDPAHGGMTLASHHGVSPAFLKAVSHWSPDSNQMRLVQRGKPLFGSYRDLPVPHDDARRSEGLRATALLPLCHNQQVIGALALSSHTADEIATPTRVVIEAIAAQATGAIARIRAENDRHRLERQILEISDREQARIGQEIHDSLCQHLVSLAFDANSLHRALAARRRPETKISRRIAHYLDEAITESRQLSRGLFPVRLATEGLSPALDELARTTRSRFKVRCRFSGKGPVAVKDSAVATHLYRIAQEAVANAIKHSQARSISIRLRAHADRLDLSIEDNGRGFAPARPKKPLGLGLHIMDYRARSIEGTLRLGRGRRGGTLVSCCIPHPSG